jgi:MFS family permease
MMGIATVLVGSMPSAETIGVFAPILLVVLRIVQGLAAGGEWAGAVLFAAENAPKNKRGFWSMFASLGAGVAVALAPLSFLVTGLLMSDEAFLAYGWRIPFLLSIVLLVLGLWIRVSMEETPVFKSEMEQEKAATIPFVEAIKHKGRDICLAGGMMIVTFSYGYLGVTYLTNYGTSTLGFERPLVLTISVVGGLFYTLGILLSGLYSDALGRRRTVIIAAITGLVWALILFPLINTGFIAVFGIGVIATLFIAGIALGPMSAFVSELFPTRYRYTAVGLSYNIAGVVGGAIVPLLGVSITASHGAIAFSFLLAGLALISLICVLVLKETKDNELDEISA